MFHRNRNQNQDNGNVQPRRGGFFHRGPQTQQTTSTTYSNGPYANGPYGATAHNGGYWRDPYYEGSTRSDWDHYAVRHEEALIGDPIPIMNNGLNLGAQRYGNGAPGPYGPGPLSNGPVNHGYDDNHYNKRHQPANMLDRHGNPLIGPVTANGPLAGNYSSGTVVEKNMYQGPGRRTRTGAVDDNAYGGGQWGSAAWGGEPLYGNGPYGGGQGQGLYGNNQAAAWGAEPLFGYRDARDYGRGTPLLPDNPWTHNELGRDYSDAYRRGTLPYSSINNVFTQPPVYENFTTYGPNGERIEGTRTRNVREEIVPPMGQNALGQSTTTQTTKVVKDEVLPTSGGLASNMRTGPNVPFPIPADALNIPVSNTQSNEAIEVLPGVRRGVIVETVTPL